MSTYTLDELRQLAIDHADALCDELAGEWHWMKHPPASAALQRGDCVLHFLCSEHGGTALLTIEAHLPEMQDETEGFTPPAITVNAERGAESIAIDIARLLLPAHAEAAKRLGTALKIEPRRLAAAGSITDHFLERMPGAAADPHRPGTAVSSSGPSPFTSTLLVRPDAATVDLHLRDMPIEFARGLIDLAAGQLIGEPDSDSEGSQALDAIADGIVALASARNAVPLVTLLHETKVNIQILSRIVSKLLPSPEDRRRLEELADELVDALRRLYRQHRDNSPDRAT